jgi:hypothetical protein
MLRYLSLVFCFFNILAAALYGQSQENPLPDLDSAVKDLAANISKRIPAGADQRAVVGQWTYRNSIPSLGSYWAAQLTEELTNLPDRTFVLVSTGAAGSLGANLMISGEIIEIAGFIRIYTRILRTGANEIETVLHWDFAAAPNLIALLLGGGTAPSVSWDSCEIDSWENPLAVEISAAGDGPPINRTLHDGEDGDYFLLEPDRDGALVMETTGDMDTIMEFFDADSESSLAENDDGGGGGNARIRHRVAAGGRYIARVSAYGDGTGPYGFRVYLIEQIHIDPDEYENDDDFSLAKAIRIGTPQQHSFHSGSDVDWLSFEVLRAGYYTIRARGLNSRLDTYIELYDSSHAYIDEDDDGGDDLDACLSVHLQPGTYYLKAACLDNEPEEPYTITLQAEETE